jgi:CspA family cold shock protein
LSQIDGLWRFAAPHSFHLALLALKVADSRLPKEGIIDMPTGTVKFFNENKGYGFIQPDGGGNDAFVHVTAVERAGMRSLVQDQRLSYELEQDGRGKTSAINLKATDASVEAASDA